MIARVCLLCLALGAAADGPATARSRVDDTVKAAFANGDADVKHRPAAFSPDELPADRQVLEPFAKHGKFGFPYVKIHEDGGDTTRKFDGSVDTVDAALNLIKSEKVSLVLQLEHLDEDEWPAAIVSLVPEDLRGELTKKQGSHAGTTVHAYVSAPGVAALPTHSDIGDVFVIQLAGKKFWTIGTDTGKSMAPGDALWVPAGEDHSARAGDGELSCHLTIHRVTDDQVAAQQRRRLSTSWAGEGFVVIDSSGKDACEGRGFGEDECAQVGCCEFKKGACKSAVGSKNCLSASQESHCSPKKSSAACQAVGCCTWEKYDEEEIIVGPNAEEICEDPDFSYERRERERAGEVEPRTPRLSKGECKDIGCCFWNSHWNSCFSDAGERQCVKTIKVDKKGVCVPADEAKTSCDDENYNCEGDSFGEGEYCVNQPDRCESGDRGCDGCSCMECNLCSDSGAFCTRSASDLTKADPCCAASNGGYLDGYDDQLDNDDQYTSRYCTNDDEALVDAYQFHTVAADGVPRGKGCGWIAQDPDSRCELKGIFDDTAWGTGNMTGFIKRLYGKDQIYAAQPRYKAKDACPIACGATKPCADDGSFYLDRPSMGCLLVASDPGKYCNKKGWSPASGKTTAKNACRAACGQCTPCTDSSEWKYKGKEDKGCDWVAKKSKRCRKSKYVDQDGVKSSVACPKACGTC